MDPEINHPVSTLAQERRRAGTARSGAGGAHGSTRVSGRLYSRRRALFWILLWVTLVVLLGPDAHRFSTRIQGTISGMPGTPSETVRQEVVKNFSTALAFPTAVVWEARGLPPATADDLWAQAQAALRADPNVTSLADGSLLVDPWPRADWHAAFIAMKATTYAEAERLVPQLRADLQGITWPEGYRPLVTGGPALFKDLNSASTESLRRAEWIALPITFCILLLVFRSVVAAALPVLVAILGVTCTLGIMSYFATRMAVTFFVPNLVTMIGLGVGIDYCLIYVARYRRERASHLTTQEALKVASQTAGRTVVASALLVISGFLTLFFIPLQFFTSIAVGGILVVTSVALTTLTLLPALLFVLGKNLEWGGTWFAWLNRSSSPLGSLWAQKWGRLVTGRPLFFALAGLAFLVLLGIPATRLKVSSVQVKNLPEKVEARRGYESLSKNLGSGWMMPATILVEHRRDDWMSGADALATERDLVQKLQELPNTDRVVTIADTTGSRAAQRGRMTLLTSFDRPSQSILLALSKSDPQSEEAGLWLDRITDLLASHESAQPEGPRYFLGGLPSVTRTADRIIVAALPKVIFATLCSTFILLVWFMRSILVPLKAIILNLLCVMAAYGFQVLCFQEGWAAGLLHFGALDGLNTVVLVICFCSLFGLSMDYEVFILSAVRESWLDHHNMRLAVEEGITRVGGIITCAALIMVSVFLAFAWGEVIETEQLGLGLSFAILLDATLIRLLLVPALMMLMGRAAFWMPGQALPLQERTRSRPPEAH